MPQMHTLRKEYARKTTAGHTSKSEAHQLSIQLRQRMHILPQGQSFKRTISHRQRSKHAPKSTQRTKSLLEVCKI
ncbi:hypothetical protein Y032_0656g1233 [Ancylostoma ceylanicum]|uniref:Uncharacterized protein n=1 Tax=Ancylostoma ceylanicum TaxID=53326 RepID=A0A016WI21_9BILA|nr:hypothetical protein Y032_0656g1233 [Ancylostoma ceylanicum]